MTGLVVAIGLDRVTVNEWTAIKRMAHGTDLVFDLKKFIAVVRIDDIDDAILILVAFFRNDAEIEQFFVRAGKIREINLKMMAVEFG